MTKSVVIAAGALLLAATLAQAALGASKQFPFVMPWNDASKTVVEVSALNPAPIDESRRVVIKDGHFFDGTGRRVRFVGTNLAAGACFPAKEEAPQIAARMHKLGFNCVRLHHMDATWAEPNMFFISGGSYGKKTDRLDPQSLDRLDYLIYQFKLHGIYVDMNLHVSRGFNQADGFPDTDKIDEMGKVVGYFVPGMIERQKLYAQQLLTHLNPYTKSTYADEPTVALIEITNEDSLLASADVVPGLPDYYRNILGAGWNQFLSRKYGTTEKMLAAWNARAKPLGANLLRNPRFVGSTEGWTLEQHEGTSAETTLEPIPQDAGAPAGRALRLAKLRLDGTDWHLQFHQLGLTLKDGETYTVSFAGRSDVPRSISVGVLLDEDPWRNVGLDTRVALKPQWQRYSFSFIARTTVPNHTRLSFVFGGEAGDVFLADVAVRPGGGAVELAPGESLEGASISLPVIAETPEGRDYVTYVIQVERDFTWGMRDYIKRTLGAKAPVACTQASYGGLGGVWRESHMDWIDMHAYWQHPSFPHQDWDSEDYLIENTPMVRDQGGGTLAGLAMHRVAGMPFTVSEYDEPAPNEYASEAVPMLFAYAAWQDWDGVFLFAYQGEAKGWKRDHIDGFFDQSAHPGKLAFLPAVAETFLRGCVAPAPGEQILVVPADRIAEVVTQRTDYGFWQAAQDTPVSARDMIARRTAVRFVSGAGPIQIERRGGTGAPSLQWSSEKPAEALFTVDSPCARTVVGFLGGKSVELDGVTVAMEPTQRNFVSLVLASMDAKAMAKSRSLLLTVVDKVENQGLEWNADRTFAKNSWASGPTMAETVTATITVPTEARTASVYALDATGRRITPVASSLANGRLTFTISPGYHTLWYEIATD
jgi:hypothetical protein